MTLSYPWPEPPEFGKGIEIADGVIWLRISLPMKLDHVNCYALDDGDGWTIVDTGFASRKTKGMWETILKDTLGGRPINRIVITHHHPDHIGLAGWFQTEHGAELWTTRTAWLLARMLTLDVHETPVSENLTYWRTAGMRQDIFEQRAAERPFNFADMVSPMPLGFRRIAQDDIITMGGRRWQVHIGNGHAPEHATFWSMDDNLVITGDQVISSISPNIGVYATEPMADPVGEWLQSCERLLPLAREDQVALSGHKLPFTGLPHRLNQLIENHHHALDRLRDFLDTPKTAADCFSPLFHRTIGEGEYGLALVEAYAHVSHLFQIGQATRTVGQNGEHLFQRI